MIYSIFFHRTASNLRQSAPTTVSTTTASLHLEPSSANSDTTFNSNIQISTTQNSQSNASNLNINNINLNVRERSNTIVIMPSTYNQQQFNSITQAQSNLNVNRGGNQSLPSRCIESHNLNLGRSNIHPVVNPRIVPKSNQPLGSNSNNHLIGNTSNSASNFSSRSARSLSIPLSSSNNISSSSSNSTQSSNLSTLTNTPTKASNNALSSLVLSHKKNKSILSHLEQCEACSQQASALENESNVALDLSKTQSAGDLLHVLPPPLFDNEIEVRSTSSSISR